jgi:hypothetical protein
LAMKNHPFSYWRSCRSPIVIMLLPGAEWELPISLWCAQLRASLRARGSARTPRAQGLCQMARFFFVSVTSILKRKVEIFWGKILWIYKNMYMYMFMYVCVCVYVYVELYMIYCNHQQNIAVT